jgi:hypothetical protein
MSNHITLIGAETVQSAGFAMSRAAEQMQRAANTIEESLQRHERFLDDWLLRLEAVAAAMKGSEVKHE